jgi:hypothetical protein
MKRTVFYIAFCLTIAFLVVSCEKEPEFFDEALLIGKWQSGTLFYRYQTDGSGTTWDEADDVTEEEGQLFTWTLVESELTHIHILEIGGTVPKIYTVTELTASTLSYRDDFGKSFSFTKTGN